MLRNLLSNGIKYSPPGSQVLLELVFERDAVVFRVSDQGIGIPSADQTKLFNAFFRGSNVGTTAGVGLGLLIVKECVDLHGGEILVESEVGVGTKFTVTLPLAPRLT
jgi:signal transduction histidine kinase